MLEGEVMDQWIDRACFNSSTEIQNRSNISLTEPIQKNSLERDSGQQHQGSISRVGLTYFSFTSHTAPTLVQPQICMSCKCDCMCVWLCLPLACIRTTCGTPQGISPQRLSNFSDATSLLQPWVDALLLSLKGREATFSRYLVIQFMAEVGWFGGPFLGGFRWLLGWLHLFSFGGGCPWRWRFCLEETPGHQKNTVLHGQLYKHQSITFPYSDISIFTPRCFGWYLFGCRYMVAALSLKKAGYTVLLLGPSDVAATWSSRSSERSG